MARNHSNSEWTVEELQTAILKEIRIFEAGQTSTLTNQQQPTPTAAFYTSANRKPGHPRKEARSKLSCAYCKGCHAPATCEVHKDLPSRLEVIKRERLCYNCLAHHRVSSCSSRNRCRKCSGKHHTSICSEATKTPNTTSQTMEKNDPPTASNTTTLTTLTPPQLKGNTTCLLKTAIATVVGTDSQTEANVLFNEGSQRSFITEKLASELAVQPYRFESINLSSFGTDKPLHKRMEAVLIHIRTTTGKPVPLSVLVVPMIATPIANPLDTEVLQLPYLKGLPLAHPVTAAENFEISLLVGADFYWDLVGDHIIRGDGPTAMSSKLGYLLSGPALLPQNPSTVVSILHVAAGHDREECNLLKFWQVEDAAITPDEVGNPDQRFLKLYSESQISRQDDGTYCAGFPWKEEHPPLPDNFNVCQKRTRSLAHQLAQCLGLLKTYDKILKEQMKKGFIEPVAEPNKDGAAHYIPHHPVKKRLSYYSYQNCV